MREKDIEEYLRDEVKKLGGIAPKWVSPGNPGVPDRIVLLPKGLIAFVELKNTGKICTPQQLFVHKKLRALGYRVETLDSKQKVKEFLEGFYEKDIL